MTSYPTNQLGRACRWESAAWPLRGRGRFRPSILPTMPKKADVKIALCRQIALAGLPAPHTELLFAPIVDGKHVRLWRFDLAWPQQQIALEIEGSFFHGGRHGGAQSSVRDMEKRNAAAVLGWRVMIIDTKRAVDGTAIVWLQAALKRGPLPI